VPKSLKVPADMVGKKAAELSTASYGAAKAWLLLEPAPEPPPATASELSPSLPGPVSSLMLETGWLAGRFLTEIRNWLAGCTGQFLRHSVSLESVWVIM